MDLLSKRIFNTFGIATIIFILANVIEGFLDMDWEDALMSWYFIMAVLIAAYIVEPIVIRVINDEER